MISVFAWLEPQIFRFWGSCVWGGLIMFSRGYQTTDI
nr:MAG TPA: hypothetical protein [Caudoviricetes sp.]